MGTQMSSWKWKWPLAGLVLLVSGCPQVGGNSSDDDKGAVASAAADGLMTVQVDKEWIVATDGPCENDDNWHKVKWVADGDTIHLHNGHKVRFLLIDTPELSGKDCQSSEALDYTTAELKAEMNVCLELDDEAGDRDVYDRLLRYIWYHHDGKVVQLNARLLRMGLARVFYPYAKGLRYEKDGLTMQSSAKKEGLGGWSACSDW